MPNATRQVRFPPAESADPNGLVAIGGDFGTDMLRQAYLSGIFPWPVGAADSQEEEDAPPLLWFSPDPRAVLYWNELHVSRSLLRSMRRNAWTQSHDYAFEEVLNQCAAQPRPGQKGTWITPDLKRGYSQLFREGNAWSTEIWTPEGTLVGGIYGVKIGRVLSAESMFHLQPDASKAALLAAVQRFKHADAPFLDIQMLTPHLKRMGAREIPRAEFLRSIGASP